MANLSTLLLVKSVLNIDTGDTAKDAILTTYLNQTEARFTGECGWDILTTSYTEHLCGKRGIEHTFDRKPVTAITSLSTQNSFSDDTWTAVSTDNYKLRSSNGRYYVSFPGGFSESIDYRLIYVAGYAANAIPDDIQQLIAGFAAIYYNKTEESRKERTLDLVNRAMNKGGVSSTDTYVEPMSWWNGVVRRYKRVSL